MKDRAPPVIEARWAALRKWTDARIALGRAGHSLPTEAQLALRLAHAQARDAVHLPFDAAGVAAAIEALGVTALRLHSAAPDRATYLQRPDLGRRLDDASRDMLVAQGSGAARADLAIVVTDGLSALAVHRHAAPLVAALLARLHADTVRRRTLAPVVVVEQGRVAIGDDVGHALHADAVAVLIGERPGLSAPDSLGVYLTWAPRPGLTDESRNCISNVRPAGLAPDAAAATLQRLLEKARTLRMSGVALKDDGAALTDAAARDEPPAPR